MALQTSYHEEMKASKKFKSQTWHLVVSVSGAHVIPDEYVDSDGDDVPVEPSVGLAVVVPEECVVPE